MAIWYELEKSPGGIRDFLESNWHFHDFRLESIEYTAGKDMVEVFLMYDTGEEGVLLRFAWIHDLHIQTGRDYAADWISGSALIQLEDESILWLDCDDFDVGNASQLEEVKRYDTWVEAERLFWAITDGEGNLVDMPQDRIDQTWHTYNEIEHKHFELHEFQGNWEAVLMPEWDRLEQVGG